MKVQDKIDALANERKYFRAIRGLVYDKDTKCIVDGIRERLSQRLDALGDALDRTDPTKPHRVSALQAARTEIKITLDEFDIKNVEKQIILLDKSIKELQAVVQIGNQGTSGPVPPQ